MKVERKDFGKVIRRISSHQWSCTHSNALVKKQATYIRELRVQWLKRPRRLSWLCQVYTEWSRQILSVYHICELVSRQCSIKPSYQEINTIVKPRSSFCKGWLPDVRVGTRVGGEPGLAMLGSGPQKREGSVSEQSAWGLSPKTKLPTTWGTEDDEQINSSLSSAILTGQCLTLTKPKGRWE